MRSPNPVPLTNIQKSSGKAPGVSDLNKKSVKPRERVRVHVDNLDSLGPVFEVTKERWEDALRRHPQVVDRIDVSFSRNGIGLDEALADADVLFCWDIDRKNLGQRAPRLRWVHAHGAGVSHLMPPDWLPKGAVLTNSRGVHGERAAEYAMMAVLMLNNRVPEMVTNQREGRWEQLFNTAIAGKTLLIVGVGSVGGSVARLAKLFGVHVVGVRRTGKPRRHVDEMYRPQRIRDLLPRADFVLVTAPQTDDTRHLIGAEELDLLKPGAGLVNYSRAGLVDYDALRRKLEKREMSAVLDVFHPEPLPSESPLWRTPNLVITPHSSSDDPELYTPRTLDLLMHNVERFLAGKPLHNRVSMKHQY